MSRAAALTGTPGTGKSAVAGRLRARLRVVEVADLARSLGVARAKGTGTEVDLDALLRAVRRGRQLDRIDLVVGHLAHLLPVRRALVLRCHPTELERRLRAARRGSARTRRDNAVVEAIDLVAGEARSLGRTVVEIDTTGRTIGEVADEVARSLRRRGTRAGVAVDWLSDPNVTAQLLERLG